MACTNLESSELKRPTTTFMTNFFHKTERKDKKVYRDKRVFFYNSSSFWGQGQSKHMGRMVKWSKAGSGGIFQCVYEIMMCERPASFARNVKGYLFCLSHYVLCV